jgi:hypothetical protein
MSDKKKKVFLKPELIKFDKPLNEVTMNNCGTNHIGNECNDLT